MSDESSDKMEVTLSARTLIIGAFVLGLTTGMVGGLLTAGSLSSSLTGSVGSGDGDAGKQNTAEISGSTEEVLTKLAVDVGANEKQFKQCLKNTQGKEYKEDQKNIQEVVGRLGTPTFFIGNNEIGYRVVSGAQPLNTDSKKNLVDDIKTQIESAKSGNNTIDEKEIVLKDISLKNEPSQGGPDSLINVIEYSDYGCPFCSEWAGFEAIPDSQFPYDNYDFKDKLVNEYVKSGDVRFIYKDYPVPDLHPNAPKAHAAANCVLQQDEGLYWKYHDKLFKYQSSWKK